MKKLIFLMPVIVFSLISGCNNPDNRKATSAMGKKIEIGSVAPDFTLRDLQENNVSPSDYKGKVLLITFWKVKCKDCLKTLPSIEETGKKLNNQDFVILTVNADNLEYVKPEKIHAFMKEKNFSFRVAVDETFSASEAYGILAVPMTYLISKKGIISDIKFGDEDWTKKENIEKIQHLINVR